MVQSPITHVVQSPLMALARHRRGNHRGTALVLSDGRSWRLVGPGATARSAGVRFRDVARGRFRSMYQVQLGEHLAAFDLNLSAGDGGRIVETQVQLSWWVSDPVTTAAARVIDGEPLVRLAVGRRLAQLARSHPAAELSAVEQTAALELGAVSHLPDAGLSYGNGHAVFRLADAGREQVSELDRLRREISLEDARLELQRRRILFFGELLRAGQHGLLAYWLARSPDDVREVFDRLPAPAAGAWPPEWKPVTAANGHDDPALLPSPLFHQLEDHERQHLREVIVSTLVAMGRDELAFAMIEPPANANGHRDIQSGAA